MLEFKFLIKILLGRWKLILFLGVLFSVIFSAVSFYVHREPVFSTQVYLKSEGLKAPEQAGVLLDGYYIVEQERRFGKILGNLLLDPGLRGKFASLTGARLGQAQSISDFDYSVDVKGKIVSPESAGIALRGLLDDGIRDAAVSSGESISLSVFVGVPIKKSFPSPSFYVFLGLFVGFLAGALWVLLSHYFKIAASHEGNY